MAMHLEQGATLQHGRYRIEKLLGQGGFGITYLAVQSGLDRKVAIKEFFMKEFCNRDDATHQITLGTEGSAETVSKFREKFLKEARNLAKLDHPNIVRVIDVFEENGTAYYVMSYAEHGSLSEKMKAVERLSEPVATRYILQVAEALDYIHQRKMNHLDVKPANIMLNVKDECVLIDFGLSKQYDVVTGNQTSTTPVGISEGYAPMEQYRLGGVGEFSPEADIYALGATFFKLLTGTTPPNAFDIDENGVPVKKLEEYGVSKTAIAVICKAMESRKRDRMSMAQDFIKGLKGGAAVPPPVHNPGVGNQEDCEATVLLAENPQAKAASKMQREKEERERYEQAQAQRIREAKIAAEKRAREEAEIQQAYFEELQEKKEKRKQFMVYAGIGFAVVIVFFTIFFCSRNTSNGNAYPVDSVGEPYDTIYTVDEYGDTIIDMNEAVVTSPY